MKQETTQQHNKGRDTKTMHRSFHGPLLEARTGESPLEAGLESDAICGSGVPEGGGPPTEDLEDSGCQLKTWREVDR